MITADAPPIETWSVLDGLGVVWTKSCPLLRSLIGGFTETKAEGATLSLLVLADATQVKIELSPVLRGVVCDPQLAQVTEAVEEEFGFAEIAAASFEGLYAGNPRGTHAASS